MTSRNVLSHLDHMAIKINAETIVKGTGKTDPESVLAARVKGMQLFVEKFAPEECREEECFSDSAPQYSPLIKRKSNVTMNKSPAMERRTTRLQTSYRSNHG